MTPQKADVCRFLENNGISYEIRIHERVSSISECSLPMRLMNAVMPRNMLLCPRNQSSWWLLLSHPDSVFRTSSVSRQAGVSRLSFAPDDKLEELLNAYPGALSPFGLIYDTEKRVQLLIDERLLKEDCLLFHPLDNTASVKIKTADFINSFLPLCGHTYRTVNMETTATETNESKQQA